MLPPRLEEELRELARGRWRSEVREESWFIIVTFLDVPTSQFYNLPLTDVMVMVPRIYPEAGPDMFWTPPQLVLCDGNSPLGADVLEPHDGALWRRFSWHRQTAWNPESDWMGTHLELVRQRFESP